MAIFDADAAMAAANGDPEFRIAARLWNGDLRFQTENETYLMRVRDGAIAEFRAIEPSEADAIGPSVTISAPRAEWAELLKALPRPFFQDLMAAQSRHNFRVECADPASFCPYYRALNRLFELMRR
jgi:hypothetical protein